MEPIFIAVETTSIIPLNLQEKLPWVTELYAYSPRRKEWFHTFSNLLAALDDPEGRPLGSAWYHFSNWVEQGLVCPIQTVALIAYSTNSLERPVLNKEKERFGITDRIRTCWFDLRQFAHQINPEVRLTLKDFLYHYNIEPIGKPWLLSLEVTALHHLFQKMIEPMDETALLQEITHDGAEAKVTGLVVQS